jgi:hypothetical protein
MGRNLMRKMPIGVVGTRPAPQVSYVTRPLTKATSAAAVGQLHPASATRAFAHLKPQLLSGHLDAR